MKALLITIGGFTAMYGSYRIGRGVQFLEDHGMLDDMRRAIEAQEKALDAMLHEMGDVLKEVRAAAASIPPHVRETSPVN